MKRTCFQVKKRSYRLFAAFSMLFIAINVNAKSTLVWLKPIESDQTMIGNTITDGSALDLLTFVASQVEGDIDHKFEAYPIKRSWNLIQYKGDNQTTYCFWGADLKEERKDWGYYTAPTSVNLPYMMASRSGEFSAFVHNGQISAVELLNNGYSTVIFEKVVNDWTKIVEKYEKDALVQISGIDKDLSDHTLLLIENRRIDFGYISHRAITNLALHNNEKIVLHQVKEISDQDIEDARILCSKTPTGKSVVKKINRTLDKIHANPELNKLMLDLTFETEGYPDNLKDEFLRRWQRTFSSSN